MKCFLRRVFEVGNNLIYFLKNKIKESVEIFENSNSFTMKRNKKK